MSNSSDFELTCSEGGSLLDEENMNTLTTELKDEEQGTTCTATITSVSVRRVRVVVSLVGKLVLPAVVGVYYAYLRNKHTLVEVLPTVVAFLTNGIAKSLASVHGAVTYPTNKIDPILRVIRLKYRPINSAIESMPTDSESENERVVNPEPEKCVTCTVLCEPPAEENIRADVVFIHGLHGSLVKTWRQGDWKMAKNRAESVELRRRASTSCLQNLKPASLSLKRSASTNSAGSGTRRKIAKNNFGDRTLCDCDLVCQCDNILCEQLVQEVFEDSKSSCWPRDWLPKDCPGIRVIAVTYTTDPYLWRPVWIKKQHRTTMEERSNEMMEALRNVGVGKNPIVWVGHSKGGLFVKQMLVDAWERNARESRISDLYRQTKAIMFYSVPHRGSSLADFNLPFIRQSVELLEIRRDCDKVLDLHNRFLKIFQDDNFNPEVFSFIETSFTFMAFVYLRIVAFESADPGVGVTWGVPLDHREICKPTGRNCFLYQELVELIMRST
ncbi:uncharacterized protein CBL_12443 [Carabus blaptoides fortunei]